MTSFRTCARWKVVSSVGVYLLEDDFDGGRPVIGYPPRLMLSASLPEIACGGTRSRSALVRVGCRSDQGDFVEGPAPFGRRLRWGAPRDRVPSSAHAVRFASRAPVGIPAPGALHVLSCFILAEDDSAETFTTIAASILVRMASRKDISDGNRHRRMRLHNIAPASREAKGAEVSADESHRLRL